MADLVRKYLTILWHWAWLIGVSVVLGSVVAYTMSRLTPVMYQATTTVLVNAPANAAATDPSSILITNDRLVLTFASMMTQEPVLEEVVTTLQVPISASELQKRTTVTPVKNTQLIKLVVEDGDPQQAANLANTLPAVFSRRNAALQAERYAAAKVNLTQQIDTLSQQINQKQAEIDNVTRTVTPEKEADLIRLQSELAQLRSVNDRLEQNFQNIRLAEAQSTSNVVVTEPASVPNEPVRPRPLRDTLIGSIVGLLLGVGAIYLMENLDNTVRTPEQVDATLKLPVIGLIARTSSAITNNARKNGDLKPGNQPPMVDLVAVQEPRSPVTEAFRVLRTNVQIAGVDQSIRTLLITSPSPTEGKSTVAANLAVVMAQAGREVILLDADLRRPRVHSIFGRPQHMGLTEALLDENRQWEKVLTPTGIEHLTTVQCNSLPPNPSELLGSKRMQEFVSHLKGLSEIVIMDTPPVLPVTDALVLAPQVDGVIVVLEHGVTQLRSALQVVKQLRQAGARVLGVVMNQVPSGRRGYGYYYQHYYARSKNGKHG